MNKRPEEIKDYNHEKVILLKKRVTNELILDKIFKKWVDVYTQELTLKKDNETELENNIFEVRWFIDNYNTENFYLLEHSKIITPGLYEMVGIKLLELDFRYVLEHKKECLLVHLDNVKKGYQAVKTKSQISKFILDYKGILKIITKN
jgi:hypothetical protein